MGNEIDNKFTMVIKDLCSLQSKVIESDKFVIGGCKWRLAVCSTDAGHLTLLLAVADFRTLPRGWSIHAKYRLTVVNQLSERLSQVKETQLWFYQTIPVTDFTEMIPLSKLHDKDGGFFVNEQVKIVAEVDVLEVIGNLDVSVESREPGFK
ncbi:hypothetical protein AALP_AA5G228200 [Arabis alpina]|uniref:MATH domain-containing protein n=1 Tax=Arabis alpina TaxID=50452 RepID=A0A087GYU9_ARAAL|nr:hypothetical protein AALP_AA5G228200 [Arabis alpina]